MLPQLKILMTPHRKRQKTLHKIPTTDLVHQKTLKLSWCNILIFLRDLNPSSEAGFFTYMERPSGFDILDLDPLDVDAIVNLWGCYFLGCLQVGSLAFMHYKTLLTPGILPVPCFSIA